MNTTPFFKLLGGQRFLWNNRECVKLLEPVYLLGNPLVMNAVSLDKGELIYIRDTDEVIDFVRSY